MNPLLSNKHVLEKHKEEQSEFKRQLNALTPSDFRFYVVEDTAGKHRGTLYQMPVGDGFLNVSIVEGEVDRVDAYLLQFGVVNVPIQSTTVLNIMRHFVLQSKVNPADMFSITSCRYFLRELFADVRPVSEPVQGVDYVLYETPIYEGFRGTLKMSFGENGEYVFESKLHVNNDKERVVTIPAGIMPGYIIINKLEELGAVLKCREGDVWEMVNYSSKVPDSYAMIRVPEPDDCDDSVIGIGDDSDR